MENKIVKVFSRDYLKNELDLPYSSIKDTIIDTSRWSVHHEIIFKDKGKFYKAFYSEGATECQDERPWEYDEDIECIEVELKKVMVTKWVEKSL
jgi:hypothetical protein